VALGGRAGRRRTAPTAGGGGAVAAFARRTAAARRPGARETVAPQSYAASVALDEPATVVLKVTYHPNWRATVDGVECRRRW